MVIQFLQPTQGRGLRAKKERLDMVGHQGFAVIDSLDYQFIPLG
jgi:hypothetical protein